MDYAAKLNALSGQPIPQALAGDYARYLVQQIGPPPKGQFNVGIPAGTLPADQQSIVEAMLGIYNNPAMLANAKSKGPK